MSLSDRLFGNDPPAPATPAATTPAATAATAANPFFIFATPAASASATSATAPRDLAPEDIYHPIYYNPDDPSEYERMNPLDFSPELSAADWQDFCADSPCTTCSTYETYVDANGSKVCRQCHPIPPRVISFHNHAAALRRRYARFPPIDPTAAERLAQRRAERERERAAADARQRAAELDTGDIGDDGDAAPPPPSD